MDNHFLRAVELCFRVLAIELDWHYRFVMKYVFGFENLLLIINF
jgi:hypothetical protein